MTTWPSRWRRCAKFQESLAACERAIEVVPDYAHAHNSRGNALRGSFRLAEALRAVDRAIALKPDYADAHYNRANMLLEVGDVEGAEASYRRAHELNPADANLHSNLLFIQAARASLPLADMPAALRRWDAMHGRAGRKAALPARATSSAAAHRLQVGYVSTDLRTHVVSFFFEPLLVGHDRTNVEIFCYASFPESRSGAVTQRLRGLAEHWRFVGDKTDADLARLIQEDRIDVLVDLTGPYGEQPSEGLHYRPAPVQASYLGFFASTGLEAMDYWITDAVLHPHDGAVFGAALSPAPVLGQLQAAGISTAGGAMPELGRAGWCSGRSAI